MQVHALGTVKGERLEALGDQFTVHEFHHHPFYDAWLIHAEDVPDRTKVVLEPEGLEGYTTLAQAVTTHLGQQVWKMSCDDGNQPNDQIRGTGYVFAETLKIIPKLSRLRDGDVLQFHCPG